MVGDHDEVGTLQEALRRLARQVEHVKRSRTLVHDPPRLEDPEELDRYEALTTRFARLQDTLLGPFKLLAILELEERRTERTRDLLNYMEKLGIVRSVDEWVAMRRLRNAIAHEYWEDQAQQATLFRKVLSQSGELVATVARLEKYGKRFGV